MTAGLFATVALGSRGVGVLEALRGGLPGWALDAFTAVTHLGDTSVLLGVAVVIYLAVDRRAGGFVLGALLLGFAVTLLLKTWLALPRPPTDVRYVVETGYGFPSGHAVGSTVGWGATALALDRVATVGRRTAVAGSVVVVVSLSRVAIGVHYLVDVLAGIAVGLAVLAVAVRWGRREPLVSFGLAGGLAAAAAALGAGFEAVLLLGTVAGALPAWQVAEPADRPWGRSGVVGAAGAGGLVALVLAVARPTDALLFGGAALATAAVVAGPAVIERRHFEAGG